ncbi:hypothetical protein GF373_14680, partial [bacterium]|nr:hypothetical protein [bacterium]
MNILIASPEIAPLAKTGGLADVTGALPQYLQKLGISVSLAMPKYKQIQLEGEVLGEIEIEIGNSLILGHIEKTKLPDTNIPVYLICNDAYYAREELYTSKGEDFTDNLERFTFFCKGILRMIKREWIKPDLIHANDWQTALLPIFIKTTYRRFDILKKIKTLFTIHNLAYQGSFPS